MSVWWHVHTGKREQERCHGGAERRENAQDLAIVVNGVLLESMLSPERCPSRPIPGVVLRGVIGEAQ